MTTVSLRIDDELKNVIQTQAKALGISMNQLLNIKLQELRTQKEIVVPILQEVDFDVLTQENKEAYFETKTELEKNGLKSFSSISS